MEALRRILPMTIQDLRARMLRAVPTAAGIGASTKPLSLPSTFGHRSSRFRQQYQCPAWTPRAASAALKKHVTDLLPDAEKATTTEGLQAVSRYEVERRKSSTRGQHLFKANGRAVSEDERKERDRKLDEKLRRQAAREPKSPSRPQSIPVTPLQHTSRNPYLPTPPLSSGNKRLREDDGFGRFGVGQSEPAGKRIRLDASPLVPHLQGRFPAFPSVPKDPFQPALNAYDTPGLVSTNNWNHGQSGSNSIGLGLNFGGLPGPLPQRPEATNTERTVSTNGSPQIDYRFVDPQNPLEKLSIQAAVFYPRAHYYALIGEYPPYFEGTYASQYNQMSALLAQNWMVPGELPTLADIGPWRGSFNMVPTPNLPDELLWIMLHPNPAPLPVPEAPTTDNPSQGSSTNIGVENVQSEPGFDTGLERDMESNDWNDDLFGEYMEDVE